ncbi:VirB4 family type IV secretion system protein [Fusibacillus kribbianus]|uniref:DUF87 domain-containing protein n=1 Tax=Fusibacillus kribbianus TaxID=3044208 RepID=A0AAP4EZI6_9FIRM|nr:DUF87 domain-containing protein [Ruminococcus sp. YH-rum2234]MDI9241915.1 DUF87 domain-containing protein [Ruminococcus sp. YH-rum2234]
MKKQEKQKAQPEKKVQVNEILLNAITPAGIDYDSTYCNLGENYGKFYSATRFPANPDYGWLAPLCNLEGTTTCIEFRNTSPAAMIEVFNNKIKEFRSNRETIKDESERQKNEKAIKDLEEMINRISIRNEPFGYLNLMFHVQAGSLPELDNRIKKVSGVIGVTGCNMRSLKYRQIEALQAASPYGIPNPMVSNQGNRNMPISTFFGGFPMAAAGIYDEQGFYLGKTKRNRLVILDVWKRDKDRVNSNWIITGIPGVGKSSTMKDLFVKMNAFGTKIIVFDPEQEYIDLARHEDIKGDVIDCAGGQTGRINPLQVRYSPKLEEEDLDHASLESEDIYQDEGHGISDLALHIQNLRTFFKLYLGESYNNRKKVLLEEALIETYEKFGITWDTDISKLTNQQFPIMRDLWNTIDEKVSDRSEESDRRKTLFEELKEDLKSAAMGADSFMWNGHTTVDPKSSFVVLDASALLETDKNVKNAQLHNIMMWCWQQMAVDRKEKVIMALDEGYLVADPELKETFQYVRNMSKRGRKYEAGIMFITHAVGDILEPEVKRLGQSLIDSACYKFLMGCDGKNLRETKELFKLSDEEENILASKQRGQGILIAGSTRLELRVDINERFLAMFGSAGGR